MTGVLPAPAPHPASFRDPDGFVFRENGTLFRQVNARYRPHYDLLHNSGLYQRLMEAGRMISYQEVSGSEDPTQPLVLLPEQVPFISYPYEWSFSQLKEAALATLEIQQGALDAGMTLKDASAYNIQFHQGRPVLIDTLSFERRREGEAWRGYRQFCQHFLAPLALMSRLDIRLGQLLRVHLDGIPLDLASHLLGRRGYLTPGLLIHLHLHARAQAKSPETTDSAATSRRGEMSEQGLRGLLESLRGTVNALQWKPQGTVWADYYKNTNYSAEAMREKHRLVREYLALIQPKPQRVWDLGANTGAFSHIAAEVAESVVAWDSDPAAVEIHYRRCREENSATVLPLLVDLTNPSAGSGWANRERDSFMERAGTGGVDVVLALALIHHLAIANNVPLATVADFICSIAAWAIIEFVPKSDSQVQRLLASREDVFSDYSEPEFLRSLEPYYTILRSDPVAGSERTLYLLKRRTA